MAANTTKAPIDTNDGATTTTRTPSEKIEAQSRMMPRRPEKERHSPGGQVVPSAASSSSSELWSQWVPMDADLFTAVQLAHLIMLQKVDEMLSDAGVPYWLCCGTLLGAVRHGGLIPHDDDVDIACFEDDLDVLVNMPLDPPLYTGCERTVGTWEGHSVGKLHFFGGTLQVDVFPRSRPLPEGLKHFPSEAEVFPLRRYPFHNIEVWGPGSDAGAYLERCYGASWRETVCVWNHDFNWYHGAGFDPRRTVLSLAEYNGVVSEAGVVAPRAEASAALSFRAFCRDHGGEEFYERYEKYRFERVRRRNRATAEWQDHRATLKN